MNCREALARLYEYLDSELSKDENHEIKTHLDVCGYCLQKYKLAEDFDKIVKDKLRTPAAVDNLKARVLNEIERIDKGNSGSSSNRNILFLLTPIAAAAVITLFLIGPFSSQGTVLQAVHTFANEHSKCLDHVMQYVVQSHDPEEVRAALAHMGDLPAELFRPPQADFQLAGAALARTDQGQRPHIDYDYSGTDVSIFVLDRNTIDKSGFDTLNHGGKTFYVGSCPKFHYVIWECGQHECIAVSKLEEERLISFAAQL